MTIRHWAKSTWTATGQRAKYRGKTREDHEIRRLYLGVSGQEELVHDIHYSRIVAGGSARNSTNESITSVVVIGDSVIGKQ